MFELSTLHQSLRWVHIAVGFLGLAAFWVPIFARKGGKIHVLFGRIFVVCAYIIVVTALFSCAWALLHPLSFTGTTRDLSEGELAELSSNVRFFTALLGVLSLWLFAALEMGIGVLRTRKNPDRLWNPRQIFAQGISGLGSLALGIFGASFLTQTGSPLFLIPLLVGASGLGASGRILLFMRKPRLARMAWWYMHMECMLGAGIAFHTAFFVFGFSRLFNFQLQGPWALLPWLLPAAIGIPATQIWIRHYKNKFGDLKSSRLSPAIQTNSTLTEKQDIPVG